MATKAKRKKRRVVAYVVRDLKTRKEIHRVNVQDKGERHAEKVMDGLVIKVDFERFISTLKG